MVLESVRNLVADKEPTPNKFTIGMGELVRQAREEANLSQAELAEKIYRRRATVSDIENGKAEVSSSTLVLLSVALVKPVTYFYPPFVYRELKPDEFSPLEQELLTVFRSISNDPLRMLAIQISRDIEKLDFRELIANSIEEIRSLMQEEKALLEDLNKKRRK
jgi:transcriptional regulator with XRE-family HTH domain